MLTKIIIKNENKKIKLLLILFVWIFLALSLIQVAGNTSLTDDDVYTIEIAKKTIPEIINISKFENNPPLLWFLAKSWAQIVGYDSDILFRFLGIIFGCFNVVFIYILGRDFFNKQTGITASLIMALSHAHIFYAIQTRVYSLFILLIILFLILFNKLIFEQRKNQVLWLVFFLVNLLLVYAHLFAWFFLFLVGVFILLNIKKPFIGKKLFLKLLVFYLLLFSIFAIWFIPSIPYKFNSETSSGWYFHQTANYNLIFDFLINNFIYTTSPIAFFIFEILLIFFIIISIVNVIFDKTKKLIHIQLSLNTKIIFLIFLIGAILSFITVTGINVIRYYSFIIPILYILISFSINKLLTNRNKILTVLFYFFFISLFLTSFTDLTNMATIERPHIRLIDYLNNKTNYQKTNNELILFDTLITKLNFNRYYNGNIDFQYIVFENFKNKNEEFIYITKHNWHQIISEKNINNISEIIKNKNKIFFVHTPVSFNKKNLVFKWFLANNWQLKEYKYVMPFQIFIFEKPQTQ